MVGSRDRGAACVMWMRLDEKLYGGGTRLLSRHLQARLSWRMPLWSWWLFYSERVGKLSVPYGRDQLCACPEPA